MKIAIICDPIDLDKKTGISVYAEQLVMRFISDSRNEYFFFHTKHNDVLDGANQVLHIAPTRLPILFQLWVFWRKFVLIPIELRRLNIDLVHDLNTIGPHTFDVFRKYKAVTTIFDITPVLFKKFHSFINVFAFNLFVGRSLRTADAIIAISSATKADVALHYGIPSSLIHVTLLGAKKMPNVQVQSKYDFPYVLSVGTLEPRKNLEGLIRAFFSLKRAGRIPDTKLVLTGKIGWKIDSLLNQFGLVEGDSRDDIILTGFLPDDELANLYRNCSCFVYASYYEGFGLPVLEAMSLGAPVITSNCSSLPEVAGDACILVNPARHEEIAQALDEILNNESLRLDLASRGVVQSMRFSWDKCLEQTISVYDHLKNKNGDR